MSNLSIAQRPGTKLVDISYDVNNTESNVVTVSLMLSNGAQAVDCSSASGDIGVWVYTGAEKSIVWNGGEDWNGNVATLKYRVEAVEPDPSYIPNEFLVIDLSGGPYVTSYPVIELKTLPSPTSDVYKTTKLVLRRIPGGTFIMGSPSGELGREEGESEYAETQHQVTLTRDYYIGVFEVTQHQWLLVMGNNPSYFDSGNPDDSYGILDNQRPVDSVSYTDIRGSSEGAGWPLDNNVDDSSFLGKIRLRTGLAIDLPTEAQWEYACRATTSSALHNGTELTKIDGHCLNLDALGWFDGNAYASNWSDPHALKEGTQPIGQKQMNAWGLYDMSGNVWEWCLDWCGEYEGTVSDPRGTVSSSYRMIRGGAYITDAHYCRSAGRSWASLSRYRTVGLRVCSEYPAQR